MCHGNIHSRTPSMQTGKKSVFQAWKTLITFIYLFLHNKKLISVVRALSTVQSDLLCLLLIQCSRFTVMRDSAGQRCLYKCFHYFMKGQVQIRVQILSWITSEKVNGMFRVQYKCQKRMSTHFSLKKKNAPAMDIYGERLCNEENIKTHGFESIATRSKGA